MTIKEQKLELYKKYLMQSDRGRLIIRGLNDVDLAKECARMWDTFHSKVTEVPKKYTLARLNQLVYNGPKL